MKARNWYHFEHLIEKIKHTIVLKLYFMNIGHSKFF
jgi:hypothetical protein